MNEKEKKRQYNERILNINNILNIEHAMGGIGLV